MEKRPKGWRKPGKGRENGVYKNSEIKWNLDNFILYMWIFNAKTAMLSI